ncbi:MAG: hypothetical protein NWQ12_02770, partial [Candidatus Nanopelagicales bacterium]|nr:hypothetical protein [Candidatus Nanopelagicales bacterium]
GQLTMRNLDIADTRAKLELYAAQGQLHPGHVELVGRLDAGGADAIAAPVTPVDEESLLDRAAMESGSD